MYHERFKGNHYEIGFHPVPFLLLEIPPPLYRWKTGSMKKDWQ